MPSDSSTKAMNAKRPYSRCKIIVKGTVSTLTCLTQTDCEELTTKKSRRQYVHQLWWRPFWLTSRGSCRKLALSFNHRIDTEVSMRNTQVTSRGQTRRALMSNWIDSSQSHSTPRCQESSLICSWRKVSIEPQYLICHCLFRSLRIQKSHYQMAAGTKTKRIR